MAEMAFTRWFPSYLQLRLVGAFRLATASRSSKPDREGVLDIFSLDVVSSILTVFGLILRVEVEVASQWRCQCSN